MTEPLHVDPRGVQSLSEVHERVAGAMSQLAGATPDVGALERAYGTISAAFVAAMSEALPEREKSLRATGNSSREIGDMLREAARRYEQGDRQGAESLGAAAGGPTPEPSNQLAAQVSQQVGQQVGQLVQGVAQSVQGLAQGLSQLPAQIVQGVQGTLQSAAGHENSGMTRKTLRDNDVDVEDVDAEDVDVEQRGADERREHDGHDERDDRGEQRRKPSLRPEGAHPGSGGGGAAPVPPAPAARPQPAQTRPQ